MRSVTIPVSVNVEIEALSDRDADFQHSVEALVLAILEAYIESYDVDANVEDEGYEVISFSVDWKD